MVGRAVVEVALVLAVGACGRIGFEPPGRAATDGAVAEPTDATVIPIEDPVDAAIDAPGRALDAPSAPADRIVHVGTFVQRGPAATPTSFPGAAHGPGNAVVIHVACASATPPTAVALEASGWRFTQVGPMISSASGLQRAALFVAIAPAAVTTPVSVHWTGSACDLGASTLGDEFAMTDPAGGQITFDATRMVTGSDGCVGAIAPANARDAVWAACTADASVIAVGAGFTKGDDDAAGDWSEYRITDDAAGTLEPVAFVSDDEDDLTKHGGDYVLSMVTLKPR